MFRTRTVVQEETLLPFSCNMRIFSIRSIFLLSLSVIVAQVSEPCPCQFADIPEDEADCRVYGEIRENLVAFERASDSCLQALTLTDLDIPTDVLFRMCPANTQDRVRLFTAYLREHPEDPAVTTVKATLTPFFNNETGYEFYDRITVVTTDRTEDCVLSPTSCWFEVRMFLQERQFLTEDFCNSAIANHTLQAPIAQRNVRQRICETFLSDYKEECDPLNDQIQGLRNVVGSCQEFAKGHGTIELPSLETCGKPPENNSASLFGALTTLLVTVAVVAWLH